MEGHKLRVLLRLSHNKDGKTGRMEKRNQIYYSDHYDQHKVGQSSSKPGRDQNDDEKTMPKSTSHSTITVFTAKITRWSEGQWGVFSFQCSPSSSLLPKNLKIKIYRTIILPDVLYGCET